MKKSLTPEKYGEYIQFEASQPARTEIAGIKSLAEASGVEIGPVLETLKKAIQDAGAYSLYQPTHGPYDPNPNPTSNMQEVAQEYRSRVDELRKTSDLLLNQIKDSVSPDILAQVTNYYEQQIKSLETALAAVPLTPEQVQAELDHVEKVGLQSLLHPQ